MDKELLGNLRTYSEVYEYVSKGTRTKEELFQYLQEIGKARSTADEQVKKVLTNQVQLLVTDGENVSIDKNKAYSFVSDICECFGLSVVCSPHTPKPENEIRSLKEENEILKEELKRATEKPVADAIINHMENSRISLESVELYTPEVEYKPFFLIDDREKLNVEKVAYINEILDNPNFSNQNKMTMYAALARRDHKEVADLIEMAARYGLDARYTVQMMEELERNMRRFISFLKSGMSQSEIRMKREVAREFIAGDWSIVAEYNGKRCHFQMVPMEELQLFLKLLKGEYYDKATRVLDKLINTKRKATFVDNNSAKEIIVKDVEEE